MAIKPGILTPNATRTAQTSTTMMPKEMSISKAAEMIGGTESGILIRIPRFVN